MAVELVATVGTLILANLDLLQKVGEHVVGARADEALCHLGCSVISKLRGLPSAPENHDIAKALRLAHLNALGELINDFKGSESVIYDPQHPPLRPEKFLKHATAYVKTERAAATEKRPDFELSSEVADLLDTAFSNPREGSAAERALKLRHAAEEAVLQELSSAIAPVRIPEGFQARLNGEVPNSLGWCELFIRYLGEEIKTNDRVERMLNAMQLGQIKEVARAIDLKLNFIGGKIDTLAQEQRETSAEHLRLTEKVLQGLAVR